MASVAVTGASGFIGRALAITLEEQGHDVVSISGSDGDVSDPLTWQEFPRVNHVFHLAGKSYVPDSWSEPEEFLKINFHGTWNALEFCRQNSADITYVSGYVYGIPQFLPITEDHPIQPNNPYALSRVLAEEACKFYANVHSMNVTIVRPFNVYGPGQRKEFLIPEIVDQVISGKQIRLKDLKPRRDYVYLDDLVDALCRTMNLCKSLNILNVGSGKSYSVAEIVDAVQKIAGTRLEVFSEDIVRRQEIPETIADISRAYRLLGWKPQLSFLQGLAQVFEAEKPH